MANRIRNLHFALLTDMPDADAETLPEDGGFLLCRAGTYGDQVNVSVIWPGDLDATMWGHRDVVKDPDGKTITAVGGLGPSMVYGLSLGPSGFPFYGSDTGGYRHSPPGPDKQTFMRWFQQTALSTVMQVGTSGNSVPWEFRPEKEGFDQEVLDTYRIYARLHLRLFPYQWTYAKNLAVDGRPIQRPLGLAHPELGIHPSDTYLFGDHLLVAPVIVRDAVSRDVPLPPGRWLDWWDGTAYEGGMTHTVAAPLDRLPLFLASGGIVPMLRPTIDTISPVADPDGWVAARRALALPVPPLSTLYLSANGGLVIVEGHRVRAVAGNPAAVSGDQRKLTDLLFEHITGGSA